MSVLRTPDACFDNLPLWDYEPQYFTSTLRIIVMPKRPNVILIVADDMGYGDFGVFNDGPARTPHLDALGWRGGLSDPTLRWLAGLLAVAGGASYGSLPAPHRRVDTDGGARDGPHRA